MDLIITLVVVVGVGALYAFVTYGLVEKHLNKIEGQLSTIATLITSLQGSTQNVHKRIDSLFTVDSPSPNEATQSDNDVTDLNEQNMYIPPDVKFAVEGGETQTPPGYEENKA